ncbi:hypothetical protein NCS52_01106500 [Fusarium sp. LHS14.1]|nr:hypothetical protein NCS52_01106500 [Fusarium sp. LHS14.1]
MDAQSHSARPQLQELTEATPGLDLLLEPDEPEQSLIMESEPQDPDFLELDLQLYDPLDGTDCTSSARTEASVDIFQWPPMNFSFHPTFSFPVNDFLSLWQDISPKETQEHGTQPSLDKSSPETQNPHATKPTLRSAFPPQRPTDDLIIQAEDFGHVRKVDGQEYRTIRNFWDSQKGGFQEHGFPRREVINVFVQLYFEHFDSQFPCVHNSQLQAQERSWILLLALAATGSQYSEISCSFGHTFALQELLRLALKANPPTSEASVTVSYVQSILLRDIYCVFSGSERNVFTWQCERSNLVFLCQALLGTRSRNNEASGGDIDARWRKWLTREIHCRVVQCAYLLDPLALIFCNHQPVFQQSHLPGTQPCADVLWRCQTAETWRKQMEGAESAPQHAEDRNDAYQQLDGFTSSLKLAVAFMKERQLLFSMNGSNCQLETFATSRVNGAHLRPFKFHPDQSASNPKIKKLNDEIESMAEPLVSSGCCGEVGYYHKTTSLLSHVASIFRLIPFRTLVHLSGW